MLRNFHRNSEGIVAEGVASTLLLKTLHSGHIAELTLFFGSIGGGSHRADWFHVSVEAEPYYSEDRCFTGLIMDH